MASLDSSLVDLEVGLCVEFLPSAITIFKSPSLQAINLLHLWNFSHLHNDLMVSLDSNLVDLEVGLFVKFLSPALTIFRSRSLQSINSLCGISLLCIMTLWLPWMIAWTDWKLVPYLVVILTKKDHKLLDVLLRSNLKWLDYVYNVTHVSVLCADTILPKLNIYFEGFESIFLTSSKSKMENKTILS